MPGPLFVSEEGNAITSSQFARTLNECVRANGLDTDKYTSHAFRIEGGFVCPPE